MHPNVVGALLNSALYFISVFVAAIVYGNRPALLAVITAIGLTYLSHLAQIGRFVSQNVCIGLVGLSIGVGIAAGALLLA